MHLRASAGILLGLAALIASCGNEAASTPASPTSTTTASTVDAPPIPLPSVAVLNAALQGRLDPTTPAARTSDLIQGAEADPDMLNRLVAAAIANGASLTVTEIRYVGGGVLEAKATMTLNGTPVDGQNVIPFVADGNTWKLRKEWVCQMLTAGKETSPACP